MPNSGHNSFVSSRVVYNVVCTEGKIPIHFSGAWERKFRVILGVPNLETEWEWGPVLSQRI